MAKKATGEWSEPRIQKSRGLFQAYEALKAHGLCGQPEQILVLHHDFGRLEAQRCIKILQQLEALVKKDAGWTIDERKEEEVQKITPLPSNADTSPRWQELLFDFRSGRKRKELPIKPADMGRGGKK